MPTTQPTLLHKNSVQQGKIQFHLETELEEKRLERLKAAIQAKLESPEYKKYQA
jgi:hypothetical protein